MKNLVKYLHWLIAADQTVLRAIATFKRYFDSIFSHAWAVWSSNYKRERQAQLSFPLRYSIIIELKNNVACGISCRHK